MNLTKSEYQEYLGAHLKLLQFVGIELNIIPRKMTLKQFLDIDSQIKFKCRQEFIKSKDILDKYLEVNSVNLSLNEINILNSFKKRITSKFIILKCLTHYAIFIDTKSDDIFAVKSLSDSFNYFFDSFPVIVSATILPFKDKIIYDGFFEGPVMYVGSNMTKSFLSEYKSAKVHGLIISTIE